ncbi:MAG: protein kinase [Planctomycetes bacterium]|nr:protein kinase [Planctomycetota bacterium]
MQRFATIEAAIEAFVAARRAGEPTSAREFATRQAHLGAKLGDALESLELLERALPVPSTRALGPGDELGAYRVVRELGHGGMGVVFEAIEAPLGRRVALKCLPLELVSSGTARARFEREAEIAGRLDHPGICTLYGAGVAGGQPWIAMRYVEGASLAARIAEARARGERVIALPGAPPSPRGRVLALATCIGRVARALAAAHAHGVLHRDVKPSNVMVTPNGEPVLLDFGLATATENDGASLTRTGETPGTPIYLAPELIDGRLARPDAQTDVYALGITLYECLASAPPFRGPTRDALYRSILSDAPSDLSRADPAVPRDLAIVVATALERDRARRYASADEFAAELDRVVLGRPIAARPISAVGRATRWVRREPRQALLVASLVLVALSLALVGGVYWASRADVRAAETLVAAKALEQDLVAAYQELAFDRHAQADRSFEAILARAPDDEEALVGRVLVSLDRHDSKEAAERLRAAPEGRVFDALRASLDGAPPADDDPAQLERASAFELFVEGELLRFAAQRTARSIRAPVARRAYDRLTEAVLRSRDARSLYHIERALAAADVGDAGEARATAATVLALWPDSVQAIFAAGFALAPSDPARAEKLYRQALELDPTFMPALQNIGVLRVRAKDYDGALSTTLRALELEPGNPEALNTVGLVYAERDCPDEARAAWREALAKNPNMLEPWANLGQVEFDVHDFELAARLLTVAAELDPYQASVHWHLGFSALQLEDLDRARLEFEIAAALRPNDPAMWQGLLSATTAQNDLEVSLLVVDRALELQPGRPSLVATRDEVLRALAKH